MFITFRFVFIPIDWCLIIYLVFQPVPMVQILRDNRSDPENNVQIAQNEHKNNQNHAHQKV